MAPRAHPTNEDRNWRRRHRRGGSRTGGSMIGLRLRELEIIFWSRYGGRRLPHDDAGIDDAMMVLQHMAGLTIDPRGRMSAWLATWAPWMAPGEAAVLIERAIAKPTRYRADTLARRLNLHLAERTLLNVTTIGAVDKPKKQRDAERKERNRLAKEKRRRARGAKPRAIYCSSSKSRTKPWITAGMSRATWYRRQRETADAAVEIGAATALTEQVQAPHLSHSTGELAREIWLAHRMR
jgi:hypothetical protein